MIKSRNLKRIYRFFFKKLFLEKCVSNNKNNNKRDNAGKDFINIERVVIGKDVYIDRASVLKATKIVIDDHTRINGPIVIRGDQLVKIGKYCAFGYKINIISTNHKTNYANLQRALQHHCRFKSIVQDLGPVLIGNNVWIGDNVNILAGVKIGDGAVLGTSSVVNRNIPPFSIAVGIPAKVIKLRFSEEIINELLRVQWWNWDIIKIRKNKEFFEADLNKIAANTLRSLIK